MNGFIRRAALGTCLGASVAALAGCVPAYRDLVDPCWPERYNYEARQSVRSAFNAQAANGHTLDQTIWNEHFERGADGYGTPTLTRAGKEHLLYLARRQPAPDPMVFVQWSHDAKGEAADLNNARRTTVVDQLNQINAARKQAVTFEVVVRDSAVPGLPSPAAPNLYRLPARVMDNRQYLLSQTEAGATKVEVNQSSGKQP